MDVLEEHMKQAKDLGSRPKKMSKLRYADVPTGFPLIYTATTLNTGGTGIITTTPVREEREMLENTWNQPAPLMEAFELRNQQVGPYTHYRVEDVTLDGFEDTDIRQNMRLDVERLVNDGVLHANRGDQVTYNGIRYNVV